MYIKFQTKFRLKVQLFLFWIQKFLLKLEEYDNKYLQTILYFIFPNRAPKWPPFSNSRVLE